MNSWLEVFRNEKDAATKKGIALEQLGKHTEAIECFNQALALDKQYKYAWGNKGIALHNLGKYAEAIECYDEFLALDEKYGYVWSNKGGALCNLGKYAEAIKCFNQALALDKKLKEPWNGKGNALYALGEYTKAIKCCDKALTLDKKYKEAWNNMGAALSGLGEHTKAIKYYDEALMLDKKYEDAWNNKGAALCSLNQFAEAIKCFNHTLALNEKYVYAWQNKLVAFLFKYDFDSAKKCLEKLVDLTIATKPQTICVKALYAFATKEKFSLIHLFETVNEHFKQSQNNQKIHEQLDIYVMAGKFFVEYGALKETEACLQKGFTLQKNNPRLKQIEKTLQACHDKIIIQSRLHDDKSILHNKDSALYEEGQYTEVIGCYDQALALDQKDIDTWNAKNLALKEMDQYVEKLTSDHQLLEVEKENLLGKNKKLQEKREELVSIIEAMVLRLHIALSENEVSKEARIGLLVALEGANEKILELKTQISRNEENIQKLLEEKEALQATLDKEKFIIENKKLKKENEQCKAKQAVLSGNHKILIHDRAKVVQEKDKLFNENHRLQNDQEEQSKKNKDLEEALKLAESEKYKKDKEIKKLREELEESKKENIKLKSENKDLNEKINALEITIKKLKESDDQKRTQIADLETRLTKMESENSEENIMNTMYKFFSNHKYSCVVMLSDEPMPPPKSNVLYLKKINDDEIEACSLAHGTKKLTVDKVQALKNITGISFPNNGGQPIKIHRNKNKALVEKITSVCDYTIRNQTKTSLSNNTNSAIESSLLNQTNQKSPRNT